MCRITEAELTFIVYIDLWFSQLVYIEVNHEVHTAENCQPLARVLCRQRYVSSRYLLGRFVGVGGCPE